MSDTVKNTTSLKDTTAPESPTTAREMDFDDEPHDTAALAGSQPSNTSAPPATAPPPAEEAAPAKPPRPLSPQQQAENTLKEAFPSIDATVVKAVLSASGGQIEPAFNALLGMSDPDSQREPPPPPQPPRPTHAPPVATSTTQSQLEADELYARQLAEHYGGAGNYGGGRQNRTSSGWGSRDPQMPQQNRETGLKPNELRDDQEHSFINDDLPVIRENIVKGFLETQTKVNSWVANLKKKIDGEDEPDFGNAPAQTQQGYQQPQYRTRKSGEGRKSADHERYDADPQVLGDDFSALELRDGEAPPPKPARPLANPNLFKPTPPPPTDRRVSFQEGPPEEIGASTGGSLYRSTPPPQTPTKAPASSTPKASKWQPLSTVEPSPVADNDPFSLGDSDDEKEAKQATSAKAGETAQDDEEERLRKAAKEAMEDDIGGSDKK